MSLRARTSRTCLWLAAVGSSAAVASCAEPPPPAPFQIDVKVESDPGVPLPDAVVTRGGTSVGKTDSNGRLTLQVPGAEGEIVDVSVTCPETYTAPTAPLSIRLTRLADKNKVPEYGVACPPKMRRVVVAVRAENGPNLPVRYLNNEIARTDESGAAHFALDVPPGGQFSVSLDTVDRKDLKPPSPGRVFVVAQQDDVLLFDQRFEVEKKRVFVPRRTVPRNIGPTRREF